jgi:hypothetical protein
LIKLSKHALTCACLDCQTMFPPDRFDAVWSAAEPATDTETPRKVIGKIPIGAASATWAFTLFVDEQDRLLTDWPGFPGTAGAQVTLSTPHGAEPPMVIGTRDPVLAGLAANIPLRRETVERVNRRCLVEYGLTEADTSDAYVSCDIDGSGLAALTCAHVVAATDPIETALLYNVNGDYPDLFCLSCLERYAGGDVSVCVTVCSRCQQRYIYRHTLVERTWYGASNHSVDHGH